MEVNEIKSLYQDGLHAFLQLKTFNHSFFGFNEEMALQAHHPIQRQDKFIQSDRMRSLLNEKIAEKHFYYSQLAKLRRFVVGLIILILSLTIHRENNETDGFLTSIAQSADFELQYIDTELSDRIRYLIPILIVLSLS